jgi:hypothetical protein
MNSGNNLEPFDISLVPLFWGPSPHGEDNGKVVTPTAGEIRGFEFSIVLQFPFFPGGF